MLNSHKEHQARRHWHQLLLLLLFCGCVACSSNSSGAATTNATIPSPENTTSAVTTPDTVAAASEQVFPTSTMPPPQEQGETLTGRLLFVRDGTIWQWEGSQTRAILGSGNAWQPTWSPDGTRIAYVERGESYSDILIAREDGEILDRLTNNESEYPSRSHERIYTSRWAFYPTWTPDGRSLTLTTQFAPPSGAPAIEYNLALANIPLTGNGSEEQIYADSGSYIADTVYTPDGRALIYTNTSLTGDGQQQLYRLTLATEVAEPFPGAPIRSYDPAFSPDGRWLAFASRAANTTDIWVLPGNPSAGSEPTPQRLTNLGMARAPVFSPDGKQLAFLTIPPGSEGFELWVMELEFSDGRLQASEPRQLTTNLHIDADSGLSWAS